MIKSELKLFIEMNNSKFSLNVGKKDDHGNFKFNDSLHVQILGIEENKIYDLEKVYNTLKKNIYESRFKFKNNCFVAIADFYMRAHIIIKRVFKDIFKGINKSFPFTQTITTSGNAKINFFNTPNNINNSD